MIAQILSTGDEILLGDLVDTNASFLCDRLKQAGIPVNRMFTVGDDLNLIRQSLDQISRQADVCLVTGGLGPTQDDLSAQACALAASEDLKLNQTAYASMEVYFEKRGFILSEDNKKQAMLPESARVLVNQWGTAPGFSVKINQCRFYFMPGVPSEMKQMCDAVVMPMIKTELGLDTDLLIERFTVFGLAESRVGTKLKEFNRRFPGIRLGFRASFPVIEVKLIMAGDDQEKLSRAKSWAVEQMEGKVISLEGKSLPEAVGDLLREKKQTLAVAESCTGGLISNWITDVAGSSDYFLFSGVTYANQAKTRVLGVKEDTLAACGAVHEQTALEMALGAKQAAGSDWAVSTTGIAGPGGGSDEKPVGTVCIGLAGPGGAFSKRFVFKFDDREKNKKIFGATALNLLRKEVLKGD